MGDERMATAVAEEKKYFVVYRVENCWMLYWPEPATREEAEDYQHGANVCYGHDATQVVHQEELQQYAL